MKKNESCINKVAWCYENIDGSNNLLIKRKCVLSSIDRDKLFKRQTEKYHAIKQRRHKISSLINFYTTYMTKRCLCNLIHK